MSTIFTNLRQINGVLSTDKTVMQNLELLTKASSCWLTYDVNVGKWSVIINDPTFAILQASFNDSNIIGGINVSGSGVNELYNKVSIEFPHKDLRDETDYIDLVIPEEERYEYELDNTINMQIDCINDPIQAQYIATVELKQSRLDKIIEFRTDWSALGLKAGDIISVTNSVYGYTNKYFRVIRLTEEDTSEGMIMLSITAQEYDDLIYDTSDLVREERIKYTNIIPMPANQELKAQDQVAAGNNAVNGLLTQAGLAALLALINGMVGTGSPWGTAVRAGVPGAGGGNLATRQQISIGISPTLTGSAPAVNGAYTKYNEFVFVPPVTGYYSLTITMLFGDTVQGPADVALKDIIGTARTLTYYTGTVGGPSIATRITAATIVSGSVLTATAVDYTGDQYNTVTCKGVGLLTAGVSYYINTFVGVGAPCNTIEQKLVEINYVTPANL